MSRLKHFTITSQIFLALATAGTLNSQELNLKMIHKYHMFYPMDVYGIESMKDGVNYTTLEDDRRIVKYSYETGQPLDTIFSLDCIEDSLIAEVSSYSLSEDEKHILFSSEMEKIYRYSYKSDYYVYNIETKGLTKIFDQGKQKLATLSPDGRRVAFVFENDLYIRDILSDSLMQVTRDGLKNHIINGEPDWVYEEEFTLKTGFYWSPDSKKIAFYRFDESAVKEYSLLLNADLYPDVYTYKYPKAGEDNSLVDIYIYNLETGAKVKMQTSTITDKYIPRIKWLPRSDEICITELNRRQNEVTLFIANAANGTSREFYKEKNDKYISEFTDDFINFVDSGDVALVMSEKSGNMHIYRYSIEGDSLNPVTQGGWEVDELLGIDEKSGNLYYSSTEISPLERHIYRVNLDGTGKIKLPSEKGSYTAIFSKTFAYYIQKWSSANMPPKIALYNKEGTLIRVLENNDDILQMQEYFGFTEKQFFKVRNKADIDLNCYRILPPDFRKWRKYPVVVFVYGGPESQAVLDKWDRNMAWMQYLAQQGYIVVCADNRGTDGRGEAFKKSTYLQLGKLETDDQIALAEYMGSLPYVDEGRIGIFGWSYGGYMSLLCLTKGSHIFNCGVAVAPVTNWKFYDTVYTERFMRKPDENNEGYEQNSPINFVDQMKGDLLLIHGYEDDNVHFQNSLELMNELIESDKHYDFLLYPGQNHHMFNGNARHHLYQSVDEFFLRNLNP